MKKNFLLLFSFLFSWIASSAQSACPSVTVAPNSTTICNGCTTLTANVQGSVSTTSYSVAQIPYNPFPYNSGNAILLNIDDTWSSVITMPFCFQFYGNTYNQVVIGSNGIITFDLTVAGGYCDWALQGVGSIPTALLQPNSIMGPYHDIDPTFMGSIYWQVTGTAPCRAFVVSYYQIPYFGDPNSIAPGSCPSPLFATHQIVLYETTNIIDINIQDKPVCMGWNGGLAIEGIQNATATAAVAVPGRNNTVWTATNESWRFTPTGAPQYSLTWYEPPNNPIGTSSTVTVCPTATTTYTATVVNTTCSGPIIVSSTATVNVSAGSPPVMVSTPATCGNNNGTATATPSSGSPPFTYSWSTIPPQNTQTATGLASGTYTVLVTDGTGCSITATVVVASSGGLSATASATPTACLNNNGTATANPTGGTSPYTYLWSTSPPQITQTATGLAAGTYTVTITDAAGCSVTVTASVSSPNGITSVTIVSSPPACNGGNNGNATATPSGGTAPYTYLWSNGQNGQTATGLAAGTYTVMVTDSNGCTFPETVTIVDPAPISFTSATVSDTCGKKLGTATVNPSGGTTPYTYLWLTSPVQSGQTIAGLAGGTYTCIITDANGCTSIAPVTVGNIPGPVANFSFTPPVVDILDPLVSFFDLSASNIVSWQWSFGDGGTSTQQNPTYTYLNEGVFVVTLIVINNMGCTDTITQTIIVEGSSTLYIPNSFTPNGDGINDFFGPLFSNIKEDDFLFMVFDRWGNLLFTTQQPGERWNGKVSGPGSNEVVQEDVYVYVVSYRDAKSILRKLTGQVSVIK